VIAEDGEGNLDTLSMPSANLTFDNKAPAISSSVAITSSGGVVSAGELSFDIDVAFTESHPGTNTYSYSINGAAKIDSTGQADVADPAALSVGGLSAFDGDDSVVVYASHTDDYGHGVSDTSSGYYVVPYTPDAPQVANPTVSTVEVSVDSNDAETSGLEYAIYFTPAVDDSNWVQAGGALKDSAVWQTVAGWATTTVTGLAEPVSQYQFQVKSRNLYDNSVESALSAWASASTLAPELRDTSGGTSTVPSSERTDGSDTVDLYYQLADGDNAYDTVRAYYREGQGTGGPWTLLANMLGDTGLVSATDSSIHRQIRWDAGVQLGAGYDADTLQLRVIAEDGEGNLDTLSMPSANLTFDNAAPAISSAVAITSSGGVVSAGELSFDIDVSWTEGHPGTNTYSYSINGAAKIDSTGQADVADPSALSVGGLSAFDGDDSVVVYATLTAMIRLWYMRRTLMTTATVRVTRRVATTWFRTRLTRLWWQTRR
jgi:hypothetical protein